MSCTECIGFSSSRISGRYVSFLGCRKEGVKVGSEAEKQKVEIGNAESRPSLVGVEGKHLVMCNVFFFVFSTNRGHIWVL